MVYNLSSMSPRPRTIDDQVILQSTARVIGRVGPVKLTLALVADEVGLSHPSIARYEPHRRNRCRGGCRFTVAPNLWPHPPVTVPPLRRGRRERGLR